MYAEYAANAGEAQVSLLQCLPDLTLLGSSDLPLDLLGTLHTLVEVVLTQTMPVRRLTAADRAYQGHLMSGSHGSSPQHRA